MALDNAISDTPQSAPIYQDTGVIEPTIGENRIPVEYGGIKFAQVEPEVKLARKLAEATAGSQAKKRAIDSAAMPVIQQDMREAVEHKRELQARIEETRKALETPVPKYEPGKLSMPDIISAGLASLFGGAQGNSQSLNTLYGRADAMAGQRYKEANQQFDTNRENVLLKLRELGADAETADRLYQQLRGAEIDTLRAQDAAGYAQELQTLRDAGDLEQEGLRQNALDRRTDKQIAARKETDEYKAQLGIIREHLKHAYDLTNPTDRFNALQSLNEAAAIGKLEKSMRDDLARELSGETYTGLVKNSQADRNKSAAELNRERQADLIKTRPGRIAKLQADTGVSKARADYIAKQLSWFDEKTAADIARGWASVENYGSLITDRGEKQAQAIIRGDERRLKAVTDSLNSMTYQQSLLSKRNNDLDKLIEGIRGSDDPKDVELSKIYIDEWNLNKQKLTNLAIAHSQLHADSNEMRKALTEKPKPSGRSSGVNTNGVDIDALRKAAYAAIAAGYDREKVKADYKRKSRGKDLY